MSEITVAAPSGRDVRSRFPMDGHPNSEAAQLHLAGREVVLVARGAHLTALRETGLALENVAAPPGRVWFAAVLS